MQRCVRVEIHGTVTGVGFRYSTLQQARQYEGLQGYVRNRDPRSVECVLQGDADDVADMIQWLRKGPPAAQVTDVQVEERQPCDDLGPFTIR